MVNNPHVVIVGASFAGLSAYLMIRKKGGKDVRITLIDKYDHFTYTPGLHECIGDTEHLSSLQFLYQCYYGDAFVQGTVSDITNTTVTLDNGIVYNADYIVIATGSRTNFWGTDSSVDHAYTFRHPEDIIRLNTALDAHDNQIVTVVGGGFTGIEVVSVLAQRYSHKKIQLIHTRDQLLHQYDSRVHKRVHKWLTHRNINIYYQTRVNSLNERGVILDDTTTLPSDITLMTAGIQKNNEIHRNIQFVPDALHSQEHKNVFICGDVNPHSIGTTAHNAMIEGRRVGRLIADRIQGQSRSYPALQEWKRLALALGTRDGLMTNGPHLIPLPHITGMAKKLIQHRVMVEFMYHIMLPV